MNQFCSRCKFKPFEVETKNGEKLCYHCIQYDVLQDWKKFKTNIKYIKHFIPLICGCSLIIIAGILFGWYI